MNVLQPMASAVPLGWVDTHCHLDAAEFGDADEANAVRTAAREAGVERCVIPAVEAANWGTVRRLARRWGDVYCLGIHPLYVPQAPESDLLRLRAEIANHRDDPHLGAVGEIGLDFFVPALCTPAMREKQEHFYQTQLRIAAEFDLPVVVHVRRSADRLLKFLRAVRPARTWRGIAHAFNGSAQQAQAFIDLGFKLGFGGALTFERALQLRHLAQTLPLESIVLETDAPDIPPHWLYTTAQQRESGAPQGINTPSQIPRIAEVLARLRAIPISELQATTWRNACEALPALAAQV
jgi:TatD DNase family protein